MRVASLGVAVLMFAYPSDGGAQESRLSSPAESREFHAFLEKVYAAQVELVQGRPQAFKALYSHQSDATILGGFGSGDKGWAKIGPRLDWAGEQFSEGSRSHEVQAVVLEGNLGYVVQIERISYKIPGQAGRKLLELRATMIMHREPEGWRIVHRHADSQMERRAPQ